MADKEAEFLKGLGPDLNGRIQGVASTLSNNFRNGVIKEYTPFIGAGLTASVHNALSTRKLIEHFQQSNLIADWMRLDLDRVAQYVDCMGGKSRDLVAEYIQKEEKQHELVLSEENPLWVLAKLPFPLYITTNYDTLLERYLQTLGKHPQTIISNWRRWHSDRGSAETRLNDLKNNESGNYTISESNELKLLPLILWPEDETINSNNPVVFHLHGVATCPETMVLSQDNYIDFLKEMGDPKKKSKNDLGVLPPLILDAISRYHILFLGYSLDDINLHVLIRTLRGESNLTQNDQSRLFSIQLEPGEQRICQWVLEDKIELELGQGVKQVKDFQDKLYTLLDLFKQGKVDHDKVWKDLFGQFAPINLDGKEMQARINSIKEYLKRTLENSNTGLYWTDVTTFLKAVFYKLKLDRKIWS